MGLTYIAEKHRSRGVIFDTVLCDACLAEQNEIAVTPQEQDAQGYTRIVRPYTGPRACSQCEGTGSGETPAPAKRNPAVGVERVKIDSSNLASVGYEGRVLVIEFKSGQIYAYQDVPPATFEAFARAESRGKFYHQQIKGKFTGEKVSGKCPQCGSEPGLIGELCEDCGTGIVRAVETRYDERYPGDANVQRDLAEMRDAMKG